MAGVKEIEETIEATLSILDVARKAGPDGWAFNGNTLTINDRTLLATVKRVLDGIDRAQLEKEAKDLNPFEVIGLAKRVLGMLPRILGH